MRGCIEQCLVNVKVKVSFYIAQYPVHRTAQSAFTLYISGRPVQSDTISTYSCIGEASSHMLQLMYERLFVHIESPLSIARYSFHLYS